MNQADRDLIRHNLHTQSNRSTMHPIYVVQRECKNFGENLNNPDGHGFVRPSWDYEVATGLTHNRLTLLWDDYSGRKIFGQEYWQRYEYEIFWQDVQWCFTEKGAEDYLKANGHNLGKTRIYVKSLNRNAEMIAVREMLMEGYMVKS